MMISKTDNNGAVLSDENNSDTNTNTTTTNNLKNGLKRCSDSESNSPDDEYDLSLSIKKKKLSILNSNIQLEEQKKQQQPQFTDLNSPKEKEEQLEPIVDEAKKTLPDKTKLSKKDKYLKLKQLEINLRNEEAKYLLLKRLYYAQRIGAAGPKAKGL